MKTIQATELSKLYGKQSALHALTLTIPEGGVFGLLGPEGSGKTTLIRLFSGLTAPSSGRCSVFDLQPARDTAKLHALCGVSTNSTRMYGQLSCQENLLFFARMNGLTAADGQQQANFLMKRLGIWEYREQHVFTCPDAVVLRLSFARALIHRPSVFFWDSAGATIDHESMQIISEMLLELHQSGVTILLTTDHLSYAQTICTGYGVLDKGLLLTSGSFDELWHQAGLSLTAQLHVGQNAELKGFQLQKGWWQKPIASAQDMPVLLHTLINEGYEIYESRIIRPTLEQIYQKFIDRKEMAS